MKNFGDAIAALKAGKKVARTSWNKNITWLFLVPNGSMLLKNSAAPGQVSMGEVESLAPWIAMRTADGPIVPWVASHYDMLAENWEVVA